jgi:hypothetical protein
LFVKKSERDCNNGKERQLLFESERDRTYLQPPLFDLVRNIGKNNSKQVQVRRLTNAGAIKRTCNRRFSLCAAASAADGPL